MATVGLWAACLGPNKATIVGAACPITLNRLQSCSILARLADMS